MPRTIAFEVVADTGHFTPLQLQPRAILSLAFNGLAHWLREHLVSFPRLIAEQRTSVVILGAGIAYEAPCRFFDGDTFSVRASLAARRQASRAELQVEVHGARGRAATARLLLCPVHIEDPASLAASPAPFPPAVLARFRAAEIDPTSPARPLPAIHEEIARSGERLATRRHTFVTHRHLCEVADQWAFFEVPGFIGASREALVLEHGGEAPLLRQGMGEPLRRLEVELSRPYFWLEEGIVETSAFRLNDRLAMVHRLSSNLPGGDHHGTAIELF